MDDVKVHMEDVEFGDDSFENGRRDEAIAIDLGTFTVDELDALCPGRPDLLSSVEPDTQAGARSLLARGVVNIVRDGGGSLRAEAMKELDVAAWLMSAPDRTVLIRVQDALTVEAYAFYGRRVDDERYWLAEAGTPGVRQLVFVTDDQIVNVMREVSGLRDLATDSSIAELSEVEADQLDPDSPLGRALDTPLHLVTVAAASSGQDLDEVSFVTGEGASWICEWTGQTTMVVSSLTADSASSALGAVVR